MKIGFFFLLGMNSASCKEKGEIFRGLKIWGFWKCEKKEMSLERFLRKCDVFGEIFYSGNGGKQSTLFGF